MQQFLILLPLSLRVCKCISSRLRRALLAAPSCFGKSTIYRPFVSSVGIVCDQAADFVRALFETLPNEGFEIPIGMLAVLLNA